MQADPDSKWSKLSKKFLKSVEIDTNAKFNFDNSVNFIEVDSLPSFYSDVIKCYNLAHVTDINEFKQNIYNEYIWGNKFITRNTRHKKTVLFFRNWIRSGVRKISQLKFIDGILDEKHIYENVRCKQNIYIEIQIVKQALLPYRNLLKRHNVMNNNTSIKLNKSKCYYNTYLDRKTSNLTTNNNFLTKYISFHNDHVFTVKVFTQKEIKLKEYNFKLLHGILPCNKNLHKWKLRDDNCCDVCDQTQTIEHLLFDCRYVKPLWTHVNSIFNITVNFPLLLGIDKKFAYNNLLTLLGFIIYKEWLLCSLENRNRQNVINLLYFRSELEFRLNMYKKCKVKIIQDCELQILVALVDSIYTM